MQYLTHSSFSKNIELYVLFIAQIPDTYTIHMEHIPLQLSREHNLAVLILDDLDILITAVHDHFKRLAPPHFLELDSIFI